jgi:hypothetical protein
MIGFIRRHRPAPGTVLGAIAIVIALAGTAGALPGKNSVDSSDIKKNGVKSSDIAANAVKGADAAESTFAKVPNAANADNATDAGSVDGHDAACPGGTKLVGGLCFDSAPRGSNTFTFAMNTCGAAGGSLPTLPQLFGNRATLGVGSGVSAEWVGEFLQDDNGTTTPDEALVVSTNGTLTDINPGFPQAFRCVFPLVR